MNLPQPALFDDDTDGVKAVPVSHVSGILANHHYLGPTARGFALVNAAGVLTFANPTSRNLPQWRWLDLTRWCIVSREPNAGSRQWAEVHRWLVANRPNITTVVSYSDPSAGHTGALYRACNWLWAPTWHRLEPPPTGNGNWGGETAQTVKDRWVFPLRPDADREAILSLSYDAARMRSPWAEYREPAFRRGRFVPGTGGADHKRFISGGDA